MKPAFVELGVGNGGYALSMLKLGMPIWAYDTFDSTFPTHTCEDNEPGYLLTAIAGPCNPSVKSNLESYGIKCVAGVFPESFHEAHPESVSIVHVDMDTYVTTKAAFELFGTLMVPGGRFLIHDYWNELLCGVKRAVDEFVASDKFCEYERKDHPDHFCIVKRI